MHVFPKDADVISAEYISFNLLNYAVSHAIYLKNVKHQFLNGVTHSFICEFKKLIFVVKLIFDPVNHFSGEDHKSDH